MSPSPCLENVNLRMRGIIMMKCKERHHRRQNTRRSGVRSGCCTMGADSRRSSTPDFYISCIARAKCDRRAVFKRCSGRKSVFQTSLDWYHVTESMISSLFSFMYLRPRMSWQATLLNKTLVQMCISTLHYKNAIRSIVMCNKYHKLHK